VITLNLENKTNSMFRKIGLFAVSGLLAFNMACVKYDRINSSSDLKLHLSNNGRSLIVEYSSGKKIYLTSKYAIKDVLGQFHINNYHVTKVKNSDGETYRENTALGKSVCKTTYENLDQDLRSRGIADDIKETIAEKAKIN
jgi:hypothetical protein